MTSAMTETLPSTEASTGIERPGSIGARVHFALRDGVSLVIEDAGACRFSWPDGALTLPQVPAAVAAGLACLTGTGATDSRMVAEVVARGGELSLGLLYFHLRTLTSRGIVVWASLDGVNPLLTLRGMNAHFQPTGWRIDWTDRYVLSRFALVRREGDRLVIETPRVAARATAAGALAGALLGSLAVPASCADLADVFPALAPEDLAGTLVLLRNMGAIEWVDGDGETAEDRSAELTQWGFHDLLFHARSRFGRNEMPFGATFRHVDTLQPAPPRREPHPGPVTPLPVPDLSAIRERDLPLLEVMERRVSSRVFGDVPITVDQLAELLYRVARVRREGTLDVPRRDSAGTVAMGYTSRPYPSGGATYELEFYLSVDACQGLTSGLYHYDPFDHALTLVRPRDTEVDRLIAYAGISAPGARPQIVISLAARFARVGWKYDAIAYATIQKHVGVVYQTLYLVTTAMGIGGCALGSGDADQFARAARTDYLAESSVGDFMIGSLPT